MSKMKIFSVFWMLLNFSLFLIQLAIADSMSGYLNCITFSLQIILGFMWFKNAREQEKFPM